MEGSVDVIAVMAGLVQTGLFADFFYVYFTRCAETNLENVDDVS